MRPRAQPTRRRGSTPSSHEPLYTVRARPSRDVARARDRRAPRPGEGGIVAAARARVAPERLQVAEQLVAEAESAAREAQEELGAAAAAREEAEAARARAQRAAEGLQDEIEQVRASAAAERQRAVAAAEAGATGVRAELEELRAEIRAARKLERERGRATNPAAQKKEAERDRKLGAASIRAVWGSTLTVPCRRAPGFMNDASRDRRPGGRGGHRCARHDRRDRRRRGDSPWPWRVEGSRSRRPPAPRPSMPSRDGRTAPRRP